MLKHAADLSDSHEYFIVWAGGTNARPWGAKADAYNLLPEFEHAADGVTLGSASNVGVTIPDDGTRDTSTPEALTVIVGDGSTTLTVNEWVGSTLRLGTTDPRTTPVVGYATIQSNTATTVTVIWTVLPLNNSTPDGYIVRLDRKWGSYPNVRVLTPYQPVAGLNAAATADDGADLTVPYPSSTASGGRAVTLPVPYSGTTTATSGSDVGVLLPMTFFEGIDGWGVSDINDSTSGGGTTHVLSSGGGSVWDYTNAVGFNDHLNGGYILLDWDVNTAAPKRSWAPITDSTNIEITVGTWLGDGDPVAGSMTNSRWTAWVPHFNDSPYAYLPGEGFTYPNHDMQPCVETANGANVRNRPRGVTGAAYGDRFGAMLVAASRLSAAIGKRVNVVLLAVNDTTLVPSNARNSSGFDGTLGWWDHDDHGTWAPGVTASAYARLSTLLSTVLPNALLAEASTKTARCLGIFFAHGEADALETGARQHYAQGVKRFVTAVRNLIDTLTFNPYANGAEIPFVQPRIAYLPYAIDGTYAKDTIRGGGTEVYTADVHNLVNGAIEEVTSADEFAATVRVDDLPRLSTDPGIYSGEGEAELGARAGDQLTRLVDYGLGFGSTALANTQTTLVDICNLALSAIGDGPITSLTDGSALAAHCNRFLPTARDDLLQMRQWGFALRRRQLVGIQKPEPGLLQQWRRCYVMPAEALNAFNVLGPVSEPSSSVFDYSAVTSAAYAANFVTYDGAGIKPEDASTTPPFQVFSGATGSEGVVLTTDSLLPILDETRLNPQTYLVEQSPFGHRLILTNQDHATLQYVARVVDADQYSSQFRSALANYLGSMLASVIIKGDEGEKVSMRLLQKAAGYVRMASSSDANQQNPSEENRPFGREADHLRARDGYGESSGGRTSNTNYFPTRFTVE